MYFLKRDLCFKASMLADQAAITKYYRLGGVNNRNLFPHNSAGWKSKTGCQQSRVPVKVLLGLQMPPSCCVLARPFLSVFIVEREKTDLPALL